MIWLLSRIVVWPVKAATGTAKVTTKAGAKTAAGSFKAGYRTGRVLGYRRLVLVGAGVGIGLLIAPRPGRELRDLVRSRLEERGLLSPALSEGSAMSPDAPSPLPDTAAVSVTGTGHPAADGEAAPPVVPLEPLPEDPSAGGLT
jgi:hypothetical protein